MSSKLYVAVDPGDKHVGVATWAGSRGLRSTEVDADKAVSFVERAIEGADGLVIEEFRLYPGKMRAQAWSPMLTAEMIGALKWVAAKEGVPVRMQGAAIKEPTRRQCVARGLDYKKKSPHASDAALHLYYFLLREELL